MLLISGMILGLSSCAWIGRQSDALGNHMPVIGERCEHWQCFTASGRAQSEANKAAREQSDAPHQAVAAPYEDVKSNPANNQNSAASPSPASAPYLVE